MFKNLTELKNTYIKIKTAKNIMENRAIKNTYFLELKKFIKVKKNTLKLKKIIKALRKKLKLRKKKKKINAKKGNGNPFDNLFFFHYNSQIKELFVNDLGVFKKEKRKQLKEVKFKSLLNKAKKFNKIMRKVFKKENRKNIYKLELLGKNYGRKHPLHTRYQCHIKEKQKKKF